MKNMKTLPDIILASQSPRRKKLLTEAGYKFNIVPSDVVEDIYENNPHKFTQELSRRKAKAIATKFSGAIVIAADTMVVMNNKLFGKPSDFTEAFSMLKTFSGKKHKVVTGITIIKNGEVITDSDEGTIKLKTLTKAQIIEFINNTNPYDKAGGYSVEDLPKDYIDKIEGEVSTILGLPLHIVNRHLEFLKVRR